MYPGGEVPLRQGLRLYFNGPMKPTELDKATAMHIINNGESICKERFSRTYIRDDMDDPNHEFWTMTTADKKPVGLAILKEHDDDWKIMREDEDELKNDPLFTNLRKSGRGIHLLLICAMRGGGYQLFQHILNYYRKTHEILDLEAINTNVEHGYIRTAKSLGMHAKSTRHRFVSIYLRPTSSDSGT